MPRKKRNDNFTPEDIMSNFVMNQARPHEAKDVKDRNKVAINIDHTIHLNQMPMVDLDDRKAVHKRIEDYFKLCRDDSAMPNLPGLSMSLHITKNQFCNVENGRSKTAPQWLRDEFMMARTMLNALTEQGMLDGSMQAIPSIFVLKNNFGYKDQQDIVLTPGQVEEDIPEADLIEEAKLLE